MAYMDKAKKDTEYNALLADMKAADLTEIQSTQMNGNLLCIFCTKSQSKLVPVLKAIILKHLPETQLVHYLLYNPLMNLMNPEEEIVADLKVEKTTKLMKYS